MAKQLSYALRVANEKKPVVNGRQYRAEKVSRIDDKCIDCAARSDTFKDTDLCQALPPCTKERRLDGENVRYVDCGKAVAK